ncbi:hypothetical protein C8J57DRAFT_1120454, partial [Mycena rebaudengoi]
MQSPIVSGGSQAVSGDTSVAPQRANLFQNAAGFEIVGGQFVLGDLHNHAVPPPPMRSLTSSAPGTRSRTLTTPDYISESDNYCSQLLRQGRGFPLYVPGPPGPEEYRRHGVSIGDVGTVTPEGFDFFFNIYLPSDHPINAHVPENFSPLPRYAPEDIAHLDFDPGNYVSTPSVQELQQFPGGDFRFGCLGPKGAVLTLPHGSSLNKLRNLNGVRSYVACHADSWYKFVNGPRGRDLENGSLYLITGYEKCPSWGMANF